MNLMNDDSQFFSSLSDMRLRHFAEAMKNDFSNFDKKEQELLLGNIKKCFLFCLV